MKTEVDISMSTSVNQNEGLWLSLYTDMLRLPDTEETLTLTLNEVQSRS
jgi:hypothetical protein